MRLIDADELIYEDITDEHGNTYMIVHAPQIDNAPTVEAKPVVHGEWKHLGGDEWYCSECCHVIFTEGSWEKPKKKFCEECGADMRGGKNE